MLYLTFYTLLLKISAATDGDNQANFHKKTHFDVEHIIIAMFGHTS